MKYQLSTFLAGFALVAIFIFTSAQSAPPELLALIFSQVVLENSAKVVAITKIARNAIGGVKGTAAIVVTALVSLGYSYVQFKSQGVGMAILIGGVSFVWSAGIFKASKVAGKADAFSKIAGLFNVK